MYSTVLVMWYDSNPPEAFKNNGFFKLLINAGFKFFLVSSVSETTDKMKRSKPLKMPLIDATFI